MRSDARCREDNRGSLGRHLKGRPKRSLRPGICNFFGTRKTKELVTKMRRIAVFVFVFFGLAGAAALAQQLYTNDKVDYSFELPSATWKVIAEPDAAHEHTEFVYGDRLEGYLQVRKEVVDAATTPADLARRDQDQKLRFLPGFVEGKEEKFNGRLDGVTIA